MRAREKSNPEVDYAKMKVGLKTLDDAVLKLGSYSRNSYSQIADKEYILRMISSRNERALREISNYFYDSSGLYSRLCKYLAELYRYDWFVTPYITSRKEESKALSDFTKVLNYLDNSSIKRVFGAIALEVVINGVYYGYCLDFDNKFAIQQLPLEYCRSRFYQGANPVVEFNMRYFDVAFVNPAYRIKVLQAFPKEIQKGYVLYKEGKLPADFPGDENGWYMLDPKYCVKFNLNNRDLPPFVGTIPSIINLDEAQDLDRQKTMQQLLKIIIQKLPLDKNGELIFDIDEAKDIHNNAVGMLSKRAIGVDVLTTFADVEVADMQDKNSTTTTDDLKKIERTVYNNFGVSQNLFNTDTNMALEKSVANDEAVMKDLMYQFEDFLNNVIQKFNRAKHYDFKAEVLETTIYNYKEISKMYKEQTQIGFSKLLPQVALGHSQSSIIATATFENNFLKLNDIMIPPLSSSVMSSKVQQGMQENKSAGRPEKEDSQKSDKTIANREAAGQGG